MSDEVEGSDFSEEPEFDFSGFVDEPAQEEVSSQPAEIPGFYKNVLTDDIPEPIRNMLLPKLAEIDSGVNKKFQDIHNQYTPVKSYQEFADSGMSVEDMRSYIALGNLIQSNPAQFYEILQQDLLEQGLIEQDEGVVYEEEESAGVPSYIEQQLEQQRLQFERFVADQEAQKQQERDAALSQQMFSELNSELSSLEQKVNRGQALPPQVKREIYGKLSQMEQASGQRVTIEQAWNELMTTSAMLAQTRRAPRPISGSSSGVPSNASSNQPKTAEERENDILQIVQRMKS